MNGPKNIRIFKTPYVDCPECDSWGTRSKIKRVKAPGSAIPLQVVINGPCVACKSRGYLIGGLAGLVLEALYAGCYPYLTCYRYLRGRGEVGTERPKPGGRYVWAAGRRAAKAQIRLLTKEAKTRYDISTT